MHRCKVFFSESTSVTFNNHSACSGGTIHLLQRSDATFGDNTAVTFINNNSRGTGGAFHTEEYCCISFGRFSSVTLDHNSAETGAAQSGRKFYRKWSG